MNFRYYNSGKLIALILVLVFFISPFSQWIERLISSVEFLNIIYGYVGIFSTISILSLTLFLINEWLWKFSIFNWLINIPNLNGRYEGILTSSFIDTSTHKETEKRCVLEIKQSGSEIKIYSYFGNIESDIQTSQAFSVSEEIIKNANEIFELFYIFTNNPNSLVEQLHNHSGTCALKYLPDIKTLEGDYYNQRGFKGNIKVSFIQRKTVGRLKI